MEILGIKEIMSIYGFPRNYTYELLNTKGCPVLPRGENGHYRVIRDEFEKWLRSRKVG